MWDDVRSAIVRGRAMTPQYRGCEASSFPSMSPLVSGDFYFIASKRVGAGLGEASLLGLSQGDVLVAPPTSTAP